MPKLEEPWLHAANAMKMSLVAAPDGSDKVAPLPVATECDSERNAMLSPVPQLPPAAAAIFGIQRFVAASDFLGARISNATGTNSRPVLINFRRFIKNLN
jgi:hypothetical protein